MFVARSSKIARGRRKKILQEIGMTLLFATLFTAGIAGVSRLNVLSVNAVIVEGAQAISPSEIELLAKLELKGQKYLIFPKRNIFLYKPAELTALVRDTWKGVEDVTIGFEDVHTLKVSIVERKPSYLWCGEFPEAPQNCFFLDASGYVFSEAPEFSGRVYFKVFGKLSDPTVVGAHYLNAPDFKRIMAFVDETDRAGLAPISLFSKERSEYELSLKDGTKILFNGAQDLGKALHNLELVFIDKSGPISKKKTALNIEYIDLRYSNKVFYKERPQDL